MRALIQRLISFQQELINAIPAEYNDVTSRQWESIQCSHYLYRFFEKEDLLYFTTLLSFLTDIMQQTQAEKARADVDTVKMSISDFQEACERKSESGSEAVRQAKHLVWRARIRLSMPVEDLIDTFYEGLTTYAAVTKLREIGSREPSGKNLKKYHEKIANILTVLDVIFPRTGVLKSDGLSATIALFGEHNFKQNLSSFLDMLGDDVLQEVYGDRWVTFKRFLERLDQPTQLLLVNSMNFYSLQFDPYAFRCTVQDPAQRWLILQQVGEMEFLGFFYFTGFSENNPLGAVYKFIEALDLPPKEEQGRQWQNLLKAIPNGTIELIKSAVKTRGTLLLIFRDAYTGAAPKQRDVEFWRLIFQFLKEILGADRMSELLFNTNPEDYRDDAVHAFPDETKVLLMAIFWLELDFKTFISFIAAEFKFMKLPSSQTIFFRNLKQALLPDENALNKVLFGGDQLLLQKFFNAEYYKRYSKDKENEMQSRVLREAFGEAWITKNIDKLKSVGYIPQSSEVAPKDISLGSTPQSSKVAPKGQVEDGIRHTHHHHHHHTSSASRHDKHGSSTARTHIPEVYRSAETASRNVQEVGQSAATAPPR